MKSNRNEAEAVCWGSGSQTSPSLWHGKTPGSFGTPTGVLRENAVSRVWELALEAENKGSTILDGLKLCASNGICSVHTNDAGNFGDYQARAPLSLCIAHAPCLTCMVVGGM